MELHPIRAYPEIAKVLQSKENRTILYENTLKAAHAEALLFTREEYVRSLETQLDDICLRYSSGYLTNPDILAQINLFIAEKVLADLRTVSKSRTPNPIEAVAEESTVRVVRRKEVRVKSRDIVPFDQTTAFDEATVPQTPRSLLGYP
jgi:hypothetical protein